MTISSTLVEIGVDGVHSGSPFQPKGKRGGLIRHCLRYFGSKKRSFMPSRIHSLIAILCLLTAGSVWSQDTKGTITGRVTDPSGS